MPSRKIVQTKQAGMEVENGKKRKCKIMEGKPKGFPFFVGQTQSLPDMPSLPKGGGTIADGGRI